MSRLYPIVTLNIISTSIFFLLGKMIGMLRLQTRFIVSRHSREIGSLLIGSAGSTILSCARVGYTFDPFIHVKETSSTSL